MIGRERLSKLWLVGRDGYTYVPISLAPGGPFACPSI